MPLIRAKLLSNRSIFAQFPAFMKNCFLLLAAVILLSDFAVSQATSAEVQWTEVVLPEGIKVSFPGKPKTEKFETPMAGKIIKGSRASMTFEGVGFMVQWSDNLDAPIRAENELREHYDKIQEMLVSKPGRNLIFSRDARSGENLGRDFAMSTETETMILKIFVVGNRLFQVVTTQKIADANKEGLVRRVRFFDSFSLIPN